jgi:hypothetical protein
VNIFISYRRTDAPSASRAVAEALRERFGRDEVFLDTQDVHAGDRWREDVVRRVSEADVVVAVIGPHWTANAREHLGRMILDPAAEDVLRLEVETAVRRDKLLIPVLVEGAAMPPRAELAPVFRQLTDVQATPLRHESWERDCEAFADELVERANRFHRDPPPAAARGRADRPATKGRTGASRAAWYMAQGSLVTIVGPGANAADRDGPWARGAASLPDSAELARHLAEWFDVDQDSGDLARVSQHISLSEGRADLCRTLHELLVDADAAPTSVHRFLAAAPEHLRRLGREAYQLLVTTSYDDALERAFEEVHEPYDLVVFVGAKGPHRGRFVHVPYDADPPECRPIPVPNEYVDLPIDDRLELTRTIIVKLHGGTADLGREWRTVRDNFVITEDDYIGYLTDGPVEGLIPVQILDKMRESHFLFLGYRMGDWTRRVFLQRVWGDRLEGARSMAVDPGPDPVERELWEDFGVHVVEQRPTEFLDELEDKLALLAVAPAER